MAFFDTANTNKSSLFWDNFDGLYLTILGIFTDIFVSAVVKVKYMLLHVKSLILAITCNNMVTK